MPQYEQLFVLNDPGTGEGYFGEYPKALAISNDGDIIVVGAVGRQAAYIFEGGSVTTLAPSGAPYLYGVSVAISPDGTTVAIGAPDSLGGEGKVYVYEAPSWNLAATLADPRGSGIIFFGQTVAAANGGIVAVQGYSLTESNETIDVFHGSSYGSCESLDVPTTADLYSITISSEGSVLAAQGNTNTYVYHGLDWGSRVILSPPPEHDGYFSESAAVSGDGSAVLVAGQANYSYIFSGSGWGTVTYLAQPIRYEFDYGRACSIDEAGDVAVIAAKGVWVNDVPSAGKAYAFEGPGDYTSVVADEPGYGEYLGQSVALSKDGTTLALGANSGRVVVFTTDIGGEGWGLLL